MCCYPVSEAEYYTSSHPRISGMAVYHPAPWDSYSSRKIQVYFGVLPFCSGVQKRSALHSEQDTVSDSDRDVRIYDEMILFFW